MLNEAPVGRGLDSTSLNLDGLNRYVFSNSCSISTLLNKSSTTFIILYNCEHVKSSI
jgi:hypothetical protein